ncbi:MAG: TIGR03087 family PEP-CTERM/XrtA system glycosyltransferase [Betaproteobacteria bacterium]|nr:TIGR03087 family PEP-CTERM/XrtA system glycosyltransferase [Betaproteobacteria bacterium]
MANLLYLVHRMPYPPDKGDKVRSYHLLKHLAARHRVFVGTFIDDPEDVAHLEALRAMCADLQVITLNPRRARLASLGALLGGRALTLDYYDDRRLHRWVRETIAKQSINAALVFSSSMVQYLKAWPSLPALVDLVDVDSAKWTQYAGEHRWPISWLYRREGERLLAYEREAVDKAAKSFLVTDKEVALFEQLAPEHRGRVQALSNGVDADYFSPDPLRASPYRADELPLVFTGAMDYWPNVDGITWFAREALPALRQRWPSLRLHIVGRNPVASVRALASDAVSISGTVPDVRPYLQYAAVVVAPLRLARGLQNKVLEAMAMARPVVAAQACVDALSARAGQDLMAAIHADDYVRQVDALLRDAPGATAMALAGRQRVIDDYGWASQLAGLDKHLAQAFGRAPANGTSSLSAQTA